MICLFGQGCSQKPTLNTYDWNTALQNIGTQSSPRCIDLNGDHILDAVIGAGLNEFNVCNQGVIAIDGKTGVVLWAVPSTDQIVGSPTFIHITDDNCPDIIIGGRSRNLMAINGKNGDVIWKYKLQSEGRDPKGYTRFNFFNSQGLADINGDGISEVLIANGGNVYAQPGLNKDRYPGTLMIMDGKSGFILAIDTMPDGLETYCSPILKKELDKVFVIYSTGGEAFGGNLYKVDLEELKRNSLKNSKLLAHQEIQGFIAPAILIDINKDLYDEVIASSHNGMVYVIDGHTDSIIWTRHMIGLEANNSLTPGYFNTDDILDLFGFFTKGAWPNNDGLVQFVLDGRDGTILFQDSIGNYGFSSPLVFQADDDPQHEVLMHINFTKVALGDYSRNKSQLIWYDFPGFKKMTLDSLQEFKNISTTPWLGDMDGDGHMEVITCYLKNTTKADQVLGMYVSRFNTDWPASTPFWGAYMGSSGDGKITMPLVH